MSNLNYITNIISKIGGVIMGRSGTIYVSEVIGGYCATVNDGEVLKSLIVQQLSKEESIIINFKGTKVFASPFFRAAFGSLIKQMGPELFEKKLDIINLPSSGKKLLERIKENLADNSLDHSYSDRMNDILHEELAEI